MTSLIDLGGFRSIPSKDITHGRLRLSAYDVVGSQPPVVLRSACRDKVASFFADSLEQVKKGLSVAYHKSDSQAKVAYSRLAV
jgi:hypothetical protein